MRANVSGRRSRSKAVLLALGAAITATCIDPPAAPSPPEPASIRGLAIKTIDADDRNLDLLELEVGERQKVLVVFRRSDGSESELTVGEVTWFTSNPSVARVNPGAYLNLGVIRGWAPGQATVSAEHEGHEGRLSVRVRSGRPVDLQIKRPGGANPVSDPLQLHLGVAIRLRAVLLYDNGTEETVGNANWGSSDGSVASVSFAPGEDYITLTAAGVGRTTITARAGGLTESLTVVVVRSIARLEIRRTGERRALSGLQLEPGDTANLSAVLVYEDGSEDTVAATWTSDNQNVAAVFPTPSGVRIEARALGRAELRARAGGIEVGLPVVVKRAPRPPDPRFNDAFWRELVFDDFERPGNLDGRLTEVLRNTSPNFYLGVDFIFSLELFGQHGTADSYIDYMRKAIPPLVQQLTGSPFTGRIEHGRRRAPRPGWITVEISGGVTGGPFGACGLATVGEDTGHIQIDESGICLSMDNFPYVFAHELGHAYGFYHVGDPNSVMYVNDLGSGVGRSPHEFTARDIYHARLAYQVGRGQPYIGWPFP